MYLTGTQKWVTEVRRILLWLYFEKWQRLLALSLMLYLVKLNETKVESEVYRWHSVCSLSECEKENDG